VLSSVPQSPVVVEEDHLLIEWSENALDDIALPISGRFIDERRVNAPDEGMRSHKETIWVGPGAHLDGTLPAHALDRRKKVDKVADIAHS
jgi:hypothetical protein